MTIAIMSGGLDSTVLAAQLLADGEHVTGLSFDYGQRHRRELESAAEVGQVLAISWRLVDLRALRALLPGSALTDADVAVPEGHYAEPAMQATVVPNRNAILLSVATAVAVASKDATVAFGAHAGDHYVYPDCRPEFVEAFAETMRVANEGFIDPDFAIRAPFLHLTKTDIVRIGAELGAPMDLTWSCYNGQDLHCGTCGTCTERREAFRDAGVTDPTEYAR